MKMFNNYLIILLIVSTHIRTAASVERSIVGVKNINLYIEFHLLISDTRYHSERTNDLDWSVDSGEK